MYLNRLKLTQFKNCSEADIFLSPKINCFIGNNGVGKTNVLDAIYYLSFCSSYFSKIDSLSVKHDHDFFAIHGWYRDLENLDDHISCSFRKNSKKVFKKNTEEYHRLADHIGSYPLVMVSPYDRDLINEGSESRRRYMDSVISQFDKAYLNDLIGYNKALLQRNKLLKQFAESGFWDETLLEMWDQTMIPLANVIYQRRAAFLKAFIPVFKNYFEIISEQKENVHIEYQSGLKTQSMQELLQTSRDKDRAVRYTGNGVHKDDLVFLINGHPIKRFGSQGQQKSFVIALKLAQFEYTTRKMNFKPILLLDDIFDKLDDLRVEQIIKLVSDNSFGQVFITDTQQERIKHLLNEVESDYKIFRVVQGEINEVEENIL